MEFLPLQPGDVPATYADITQIQQQCGYHPTTRITAGIPKFTEWYKDYITRMLNVETGPLSSD